MSSPTNVLKPPAFEAIAVSASKSRNNIAMGYDAIASEYDSQMLAAQWIRERLWQRMDVLFPAQSKVLDITAGTGLDVFHLMQRDVSVIACDVSPKMLDLLRERNPLVKTIEADFNQLEIEGEFDGIITTFAGLNTSADLSLFADKAAGLLRPGGILFIHVLNRWPLFNVISQMINLHWWDAWRTIIMNPRNVNLGGVSVPHYLYSPLSLHRKVFARHFQLSHVEGQGILRPLNVNWGERLEVLERRLAPRFPFYPFGVFFSMELRRD